MTYLFKALTHEAYTLRSLIDLLQNNVKTAYFEIDRTGISLSMTDQNRRVGFSLFLNAENFIRYGFKSPRKLIIGLNLTHFHKMIKPVKKKDSLKLVITSDNPTELVIHHSHVESRRTTISSIKIISV